MADTNVEALRIQGLIRPLSVQPFWLFDGRSLSDEVDQLARRCRTNTPNSLKQDLYQGTKPRSLPGVPFEGGSQAIKWKTLSENGANLRLKRKHPMQNVQPMVSVVDGNEFRNRVQSPKNQNNAKEDSFKKVLQKFQPPEAREVTLCPGYVIMKGRNEVTASIKPDELFNSKSFEAPQKERRRSSGVTSDETRLLIEQLDKIIDELTAALEEEKFNHKENMKKMSEHYQNQLEQINEEHVAHVKALEADHFKDLKKLEDSHRLIVKTIREEAMKENAALSRELKDARALFETHKEALALEMMADWEARETEVRLECDRKAEKMLLDQRNEMRSQKNRQLDEINKEHARQIALMVDANNKEKDILLHKMTASLNDAERIKKSMAELEQTKAETEDLRSELNGVKYQYRVASNELRDMKQQLQMYKDHFAEKVSQVDEKYAQQINALMMENQSIRQQYLKKCDELFQIKSERDTKQEDDLVTAKDVMHELIRVRARADINLVTSDWRDDFKGDNKSFAQAQADDESKSSKNKETIRPSSAPSTPKEMRQAVRDTLKEDSAISAEKSKKNNRPSSSRSIASFAPAILLPDADTRQITPNSRRKVRSARLLTRR